MMAEVYEAGVELGRIPKEASAPTIIVPITCAGSGGFEPPSPATTVGDDDVPETPLPIRQMAALTVVLMNESLCATMLFPVVGLLVAHLENESPNDAGYQTGFLVGVFQLGQVVSGKLWGKLSDRYGRRPALLSGAALSGIVMLLFGLSQSFALCVILRFLHGIFNGNILVAKAVIADITDKTNESKGFTLISFAWGMGSLLGPAVGGFLYQPSSSSVLRAIGFQRGGLFDRNPALLPSLVIFLYSCIAVTVTIAFLKESNTAARPLSELVSKAVLLLKRLWQRARRLVRKATHRLSERTALASAPAELEEEDEEGAEAETTGSSPAPFVPISKFGYREAFACSRTRIPLILYGVLSGFDIAFVETLPLWAIASRPVGGLAFDHTDIGLLILCGSVPTLLANIAFPRVRKYFHDDIRMWHVCAVVCATLTLLVSATSIVRAPMVPLIVLTVLRMPAACWLFSMCFLIIARSAPREHVGAINGIGQSAGCAIRSLVPPLVAPIFAWSIEKDRFIHVFPFDHSLVFVLACGALLATIPFASKLSGDMIMRPREIDAVVAPSVSSPSESPVCTPASASRHADAQADRNRAASQSELDSAETLSL